MTDETDVLTARARQLEEENALLRSMQSPSGQDSSLRAENIVLRSELGLVRREARPGDVCPDTAEVPQTLEEFAALPPEQRQTVARQMNRQQRDHVLGRRPHQDRESYL